MLACRAGLLAVERVCASERRKAHRGAGPRRRRGSVRWVWLQRHETSRRRRPVWLGLLACVAGCNVQAPPTPSASLPDERRARGDESRSPAGAALQPRDPSRSQGFGASVGGAVAAAARERSRGLRLRARHLLPARHASGIGSLGDRGARAPRSRSRSSDSPPTTRRPCCAERKRRAMPSGCGSTTPRTPRWCRS